MARIHHDSFVQFVNTGKTQRHGSLTMKGDTVFSYTTPIAIVDRVRKVIKYNPTYYSRTTTCHQHAVTVGATRLWSAGWTLENTL